MVIKEVVKLVYPAIKNSEFIFYKIISLPVTCVM